MPVFDLARRYQFGVFLRPANPPSQLDAVRAAEILATQPPQAPQLSLKLNRPGNAQQVFQSPDGVQLLQIMSFSGPPLWRADFSSIRIDVHVDASGYQEITGKPLPLDDVRRRITPNFARLTSEMGIVIGRMVAVVTLEGTAPDAAVVVADQMFSTDTQQQLARGEILELGGKRNLAVRWKVGTRTVYVNRIETADAAVQYESSLVGGPTVEKRRTLTSQFDVNTSPAEDFQPTAGEIESFYEQAVRWIDERVNAIESK